jgi:aminoglycoside phosphotransferase family enzyme
MIVEDQHEAVAFLSEPAILGAPGAEIRRIDTHGAMVFLVGDRAFKLKRAVRFPYMDFSTVERRHAMCEAEIRLNRRTAPDIYLGVRALTRGADGRLRLDGTGPVVDWVVEMVRFDEDTLFDRLAQRGALEEPLIEALADVIVDFHDRAERRPGGGAASLQRVIDTNAREFAGLADGVLDAAAAARLTALSAAMLDRYRQAIEQRREAGFVRRCHGDLHLRNVCLFEGRPTLFDALEFDDDLATHDVLYDLAFLLMDLWHRGLRRFANVVMNRYLWRRPTPAALAPMPLYLSLRAGVRAHVSASMAEWQEDATAAAGFRAEARTYLGVALDFLAPRPPLLIALGGLSGSGKSTLAGGLAEFLGRPPGAFVLRSDIVRKELSGVDFSTRLGPGAYTPDLTARVYETLLVRAGAALAAGQATIVDAVHAIPEERAAVEALARANGVPFAGLWLEASTERMTTRISARRDDASDATIEVLERQLTYDLGEVAWSRLDASGSIEATLAAARRMLEEAGLADCDEGTSMPS